MLEEGDIGGDSDVKKQKGRDLRGRGALHVLSGKPPLDPVQKLLGN